MRDLIANATGIDKLIRLLSSPVFGTPEAAARVLAHLACKDECTSTRSGSTRDVREPSKQQVDGNTSDRSQADRPTAGVRAPGSAAEEADGMCGTQRRRAHLLTYLLTYSLSYSLTY